MSTIHVRLNRLEEQAANTAKWIPTYPNSIDRLLAGNVPWEIWPPMMRAYAENHQYLPAEQLEQLKSRKLTDAELERYVLAFQQIGRLPFEKWPERLREFAETSMIRVEGRWARKPGDDR